MDKKEKRLWRILDAREEREHRKVEKMLAKKDILGIEKWLKKFSIEGDFWLREKKQKDDWL